MTSLSEANESLPDHTAIDATPTSMDVRDHTVEPSKCGGERNLFAAALHQAILDLGGNNQRDKDESIRLLTDEQGEYARHRTWLCFQAGIDPESFFERVSPIARQAAVTPISKGKTASKNRKAAFAVIKMEAFQ